MNSQQVGFKIDSVLLKPVLGDIREADVDVIVQSAGTSPQGRPIEVSDWVRQVDDGSIGKALAAHAPLQLGRVIVTGAGKAKAKYLLSAVVIDWDGARKGAELVDRQVVAATARRCVALAAALGVRSVAFAPWGTYIGAIDSSQATAIMVQAIIAEIQSGAGSLQEVWLISNVQKHYDWFVDRAFVFDIVYSQVERIRQRISELPLPEASRQQILQMLDNLRGNVLIFNETVGGDKYSIGDISGSEGLAIGDSSSARVGKETE